MSDCIVLVDRRTAEANNFSSLTELIECRIPRYSVKLGFVKSLAVDPSHEIREAIGNPLLDRQIVGESQVGLVSVRSMLVRHALDESK